MRAVAAERAFDQIRLVESERREDVLPERVAQRHAGRLLDDEPQYEVVAAVVRPPLARREQARLLHDQLELLAVPELVAVRRVAAVRLEELHEIDGEIVEAARVVQELADGDALRERAASPSSSSSPSSTSCRTRGATKSFVTLPTRKRCPAVSASPVSHVRKPGRCLDPAGPAAGHDDGARHTGCDDGLELILNGFHGGAATLTR